MDLSELIAKSAKGKEPEASAPDEGNGPKYQQMYAKNALVRPDQITALDEWARELNRIKDRKVERITANTLIRVAIDALLSVRDQVHGATEDELRRSIGIEIDEG